MDYEQLKTFLVVAEVNSFTKAAEILHVTQSTVTSRIQKVEQFYGQILINRTQRDIRLSETGIEILPVLQGQMDLWEKSRNIASSHKQSRQEIRISSTYSLWENLKMSIMKGVQQLSSDIYLKLETDHSPVIIQKVLDGIIDFGVVYNKPVSRDLVSLTIKEDKYSLYRDNNLHLEEPWDLNGLIRVPWIYLNWGHMFESWVNSVVQDGVKPTVEVGHSELAVKLVHQLGGVAFLSDDYLDDSVYSNLISSVKIDSDLPAPTQTVHLIFKKSRRNSVIHQKVIAMFVKEGDVYGNSHN